jgi:ABC-type antimicrobial peptide transport system permease subunit
VITVPRLQPQTKNYNKPAMFRNYFKIAWRNLLQNKGLAFINIFGLAIGMAFAILIGLWIQYETSFDQFHVNKKRIAVVRKNTLFNNQKNTATSMPLPLSDELKKNYPEVERVSRMSWNESHSLMIGDNKFNKKGLYADPDFLKMFSFPLVKGNISTALNDPNTIVLTESLAKTLFGQENPIGKPVKIDNQYTVLVSAVAKDVPTNSSITFDFLAPFEFKIANNNDVKKSQFVWNINFLMNVVEVKEGASISALSKKIAPILMQKRKDGIKMSLFLQPFDQFYLHNEYKNWVNVGGRIDYVHLFAIIGIFVLFIACINFMNLSTARSEKRAKEVGIRKAVGSQRMQLIIQFLSESMLTAFFAFLLSLGLVQILIPLLKDVGFENIRFNFKDVSLMASVFGICVLTGVIAGSYPALYLSSFLPVKVLKGIAKQGVGAIVFRKTLVITQFVISIGLIVCTIIVFQQISNAKDRNLGYDPNNLISIFASLDMAKNYDAYKQELLNTGYIESVAKASSPITDVYGSWSGFSWEGKDPNEKVSFDAVQTEWDYEKTVGLKFKLGRPFSRDYKLDSNGIIINEAALNIIGFKNPIGKIITLDDKPLTITGVVENVVMRDPFKTVSPAAIIFNSDPKSVSAVLLRLTPKADLRKALAAIKPITEKYNPALPFEYSFVDEDFSKKFATENRVGKLAGIFAGLAIFISCLGLFGLATFMAERRTKEVGIRKVLGASIANLWMLLSKEFVILVMVAGLIASPLALWLMHNWLQKYDYRIAINGWIFAIAILAAVIIALFTVSAQAIKAALLNPVKSLRTE